jgi:hypothetical protein
VDVTDDDVCYPGATFGLTSRTTQGITDISHHMLLARATAVCGAEQRPSCEPPGEVVRNSYRFLGSLSSANCAAGNIRLSMHVSRQANAFHIMQAFSTYYVTYQRRMPGDGMGYWTLPPDGIDNGIDNGGDWLIPDGVVGRASVDQSVQGG